MATLVLAAAGSAFGGSLGGSILGLTTAALGKAAGATLGSLIDQRLLGAGAAAVETGRVDRLRVMGSSEGAPLPRCYGRMRLAGQLIWSSRFCETVSRQRVGAKGTGPSQTVKQYSYTISLALALCEGEILRIGRIWADGQPLAQSGLTLRLHTGSEDQLPDPLIAAIEGGDAAPAYRGTAYVVIEDLDLAPFGNRIPQLNFEVFRLPAQGGGAPRPAALEVRGVALVPGTGEYSLATEPVTMVRGRGESVIANVNNDRALPDLVASLDQMEAELPDCLAVSLVVSWFADDLRIGSADLYPAVEQREVDGEEMPWRVAGVTRGEARVVNRVEDRPLFGGTPSDTAVIQAIRHLRASGRAVMFYPFILLDVVAGNRRPDPWALGEEQPPVPWRGRMTLSVAPGLEGSPDRTPAAADEVGRFFGAAEARHFSASGQRVVYSGPQEWSYRRFILHYARLCALAGGVDAFCVGSEMRSLTQIRDGAASYPAVRELCRLAEDVRRILGPAVKISYAADWSEYFGHQPADGSGDVLFHLDPFWAHPDVDFVGIDNYMPLSDWRDGTDHADAEAGSIYALDYLTENVAGGEGYDWYYPDAAARVAQERAPIEDGAYGEPWVYRYKDLVGWWTNVHVNRIGGVKTGSATNWVPRSKPIWFTELGCPAVDKGTNQPNVFHDPKSSESFLPHFSTGSPDDLIQHRYIQAMTAFWSDGENNPASDIFGGRMVDLDRCFVWAWDARPWPDFPSRLETWVDGTNHSKGHWLNGRIAKPDLSDIIREVCGRCGLRDIEAGAVHEVVTGYLIDGIQTGRQSLQPLMMAFGLDAHPVGEGLAFAGRSGRVAKALDPNKLVWPAKGGRLERTRSSRIDLPERVTLSFIRADEDYQAGAVDFTAPDAAEPHTAEASVPLVLGAGEAQEVVERWLHQVRVAQEAVAFSLPPSCLDATPGDVVEIELDGRDQLFRIDRADGSFTRKIEAVAVDEAILVPHRRREDQLRLMSVQAATPAHAIVLDLPLVRGDEVPHAPHVAVLRKPWAGPVAVYTASGEDDYALAALAERPATIGRLLEPLPAALPGLWMRRSVRLRLDHGELRTRSAADVLDGANLAVLRAAGSETGNVELIQFCGAELVAPMTYRISLLLRGQAGTDASMPEAWPEGTDFVLVDPALQQINAPPASLGAARRVRYGPADRPLSDPSFRTSEALFGGVGLRPYAPVHLRARKLPDGSVALSWIRRSRIGGDGWRTEIPVGEESLSFEVKVLSEGRLCRASSVDGSDFTYSQQERLFDGAIGPLVFEVAQVSSQFGLGLSRRIVVDG